MREKSVCYVNKAPILYLFTNFVKYGITVSLTKLLVANNCKVNWFNVFINKIIHRRKKHMIEIYTNEIQMKTISKTRKNFKPCILLVNHFLTFKFWRSMNNANIEKYIGYGKQQQNKTKDFKPYIKHITQHLTFKSWQSNKKFPY